MQNHSLVSVVVITWNRRDEVLANLARLSALPERPRIIVIDNRSTGGRDSLQFSLILDRLRRKGTSGLPAVISESRRFPLRL